MPNPRPLKSNQFWLASPNCSNMKRLTDMQAHGLVCFSWLVWVCSHGSNSSTGCSCDSNCSAMASALSGARHLLLGERRGSRWSIWRSQCSAQHCRWWDCRLLQGSPDLPSYRPLPCFDLSSYRIAYKSRSVGCWHWTPWLSPSCWRSLRPLSSSSRAIRFRRWFPTWS